MKKNILIIALILWVIPSALFGQNIKVLNTVTVIDRQPQVFTAPQFSPDGKQILFSEAGYKGLWLYDIETKTCIQLNDYLGAGYAPFFSPSGERIYFWTDNYIKFKRYSSLVAQSVIDKKIHYIVKDERHLFPVSILNDETIIYRQNKELKTIDLVSKANVSAKTVKETVGYIEDQKIVIISAGNRKELKPFGTQNYIWFSLSPDKTKMLFTIAGGSTYICDLDGNVFVELRKAHAPKWSPDGNWIVYMDDKDDGHTFTSSDIWAARSDGTQKIQLTKTNDAIELYPAWSPKMDKIVYETFSGKIAYMNIQIK